MTDTSAYKLAEALLEQNCDQEHFEVGLEENEVDQVTAALKELGCSVEREEFKPLLRVHCPGAVLQRVRDRAVSLATGVRPTRKPV